jgi:NTP pyrophosphatase (non-canonical NTP hydrolase)
MDLAELQRLMDDTYGVADRERGVAASVAWLVEEVGELAQALRKGDNAQRLHEFADVLAWTASLANQAGIDLNEAMQRYENGCPACGSVPCRCGGSDDIAQLAIVQFPHPRLEHRPDQGDRYSWNTGPHGRKFMRAHGRWVEGPDRSDRVHDGELVFWGEWESLSRVIREYPTGQIGMPRYVVKPQWTRPAASGFLQNTDPYVFGGPFKYSNCRQNTWQGRPKAMQRLDLGSLILFGSLIDGDYVLDTAFVVARRQALSRELVDQADGVDEAFRAVVTDVLYRDNCVGHENTLFDGATPDNRIEGMFSFFPCLSESYAPAGFARPVIRLPGIINERSRQSERRTLVDSLEEVRAAWESTVAQVLDQGLALGVFADTPAHVDSLAEGADEGSC